MKVIALVMDDASLPVDYDMDCLQASCEKLALPVTIQRWDAPRGRLGVVLHGTAPVPVELHGATAGFYRVVVSVGLESDHA